MRFLLAALSVLSLASGARASSPAAEAAFTLEVAETCAASSGLKHAHASQIVMFDDSLNKVVTLVTGIFPQRALKGATGRMLCVYDKRTKRVWIDEAKGWTAPDLK